ncbi:hypothetical protein EDM57_11235 [Brevibacillus gelatini]|uniref:Uncharacterized protein n=1 Tax=Brevibacillus gelatini TaxID=1655277 RepID=A0A3M8B0B9_9BACL|nr:hypothetical protein EDM57_11235 [Brevibacillus gelatini]
MLTASNFILEVDASHAVIGNTSKLASSMYAVSFSEAVFFLPFCHRKKTFATEAAKVLQH